MACILFVLCLTGVASGQSSSPEKGHPLLGEPAYLTLKNAWYEVQSALSRDEWAEAEGRLGHVRDVQMDLGLPNLFEFSEVLLRAAERAAQNGDSAAAIKLNQAATSLSPGLSASRFSEASRALDEDLFALPEALKMVRLGYEELTTDLPGWTAFVANSLSGGLLVLLLGLIVAYGVMLLRYGGCVAADLQRLARGSLDRFQGWILWSSLALLPLVLGMGLLVTIALNLLVLVLYAGRAERAMLALLLGGLTWVLPASSLVERAKGFETSPEAVLTRCSLSLCGFDERAYLHRLATKKETAHAAHLNLAVLELRHHRLNAEALGRARAAIKKAIAAEDTWQARVVHGNMAYAEALGACPAAKAKDAGAWKRYDFSLEEALGYWELALKMNEDAVAALFNASVAARLLGKDDAASGYRDRAIALDPERVDRFDEVSRHRNGERCAYWTQLNRHVMSPRSSIAASSFFDERPEVNVFSLPFPGVMTGRMGGASLHWVALAGSALAFVLFLLGWVGALSTPCRRCPSVAVPALRVKVDGGAVCHDCVLAEVGRGVVDAKRQWQRDRVLSVRKQRRRRLGQVMTWFVPGFENLMTGRPMRGLVTTLLIYGCLVLCFDAHRVVEHVHRGWGASSWAELPLVIIAGSLYVLALVRVHRRGGSA